VTGALEHGSRRCAIGGEMEAHAGQKSCSVPKSTRATLNEITSFSVLVASATAIQLLQVHCPQWRKDHCELCALEEQASAPEVCGRVNWRRDAAGSSDSAAR
jgi:hypothetical protein